MRLGVCYYPEQWPEAWWVDDAARMVALGIRQVRIGEFAWGCVEPRPGEFDWGWLDRVVEVLAAAGMEIVMGTPTACPPRWLVDRHPEILPVGADGRTRGFGSRRHYDFSSDVYLEEARRITRLFGERYGAHPAVTAWQIDNEYGCHDTVLSYSAAAVARFRGWLRQRYRDIDALNRAWGNVFWSQQLGSFAEVDAPVGTVTEPNPAQAMDWRRFASDEVVRFNRTMAEVLRPLAPGRPLVHNFMQLFTAFDHHTVAADLDVASWDSYPIGALEMFWFDEADKARWMRSGHPDFAAFHHDLYRGMSRRPFWVMEQQPGPVNWARWNPAPAPGMVRLWTWEAFAHGAEVVSYFRWRQAPFAQEQMHAGLFTPQRQLDIGGAEATQVARELALVPPQEPQRAAVAMVFDYSACWLFEVQPQGADYSALRIAFEAYSALRSLGLDIDIVGPEADLSGYALIVLPAQPIVAASLVDRLRETDARIVLYPRAGSKDAPLRITSTGAPGALQALIDLQVPRVESLRPGITVPLVDGGHALRWREWAEPGPDVRMLARFQDGAPAVLAQGRTRYLTGWFDPSTQRRILRGAAHDAGLATAELPPGLRLRRRGELLFAFNHDDHPLQIHVPQATWLIGGPRVPPHGLAVAQKRYST